jgi:MoaA/NifB/PqqE/SkfB family radical SAM enzyme
VDRELETEEWKKILENAWAAGIPHVTFTGGEPTRRDDLVELVEFAEIQGQVTGVLTDGRQLSNNAVIEALSQAGLDHFLIVFIPDDADSLAGIKNALASDVFTAIHLTLNADFEPQAVEWLRRFSDMGVQAISISGDDDPTDLTGKLSELREIIADMGMDLIWDLPVPYSHVNPINQEVADAQPGTGRAWLYVEPDGDVLPGQGVDNILGNFLRDPWESIWKAAQENME